MSLECLLDEKDSKTIIDAKKEAITYAQFMGEISSGKYYVVVKSFSKVLIGLFTEGKFCFADDEMFDEDDIVELHIFNEECEYLLKRMGNIFKMRLISDVNGSKKRSHVDSSSELFGSIIGKYDADAAFLHLVEPGRNISLDIPNVGKSKNDRYELATRSYIFIDEKTGQAGFNVYRYLDIRKGGEL